MYMTPDPHSVGCTLNSTGVTVGERRGSRLIDVVTPNQSLGRGIPAPKFMKIVIEGVTSLKYWMAFAVYSKKRFGLAMLICTWESFRPDA